MTHKKALFHLHILWGYTLLSLESDGEEIAYRKL
jgi:hypothetical protein